MNIQAIETEYHGYKFRSRLEARWAYFFDQIGVEWHYEHEGYETPYGRYVPDFWLPSMYLRSTKRGVLFEVKPENYGSEHDALEYVAAKLGVGAVLANGFRSDDNWSWEGLYELHPQWDEPMLIYTCPHCRAAKVEFTEGSYMQCPQCGRADFNGMCAVIKRAYNDTLRYRFW